MVVSMLACPEMQGLIGVLPYMRLLAACASMTWNSMSSHEGPHPSMSVLTAGHPPRPSSGLEPVLQDRGPHRLHCTMHPYTC